MIKKDKEIEKNFRIFETTNSMILLYSKNISQYFTDWTYKCIPAGLENRTAMIILIWYNNSLDKIQLILIVLISNEDADIFTEF